MQFSIPAGHFFNYFDVDRVEVRPFSVAGLAGYLPIYHLEQRYVSELNEENQ